MQALSASELSPRLFDWYEAILRQEFRSDNGQLKGWYPKTRQRDAACLIYNGWEFAIL